MNHTENLLLLVMVVSCASQFIAAAMAIHLIRISGVYTAWVLLACGFIIQGVRRGVSLVYVVNGQMRGDLTVETLGLLISLFMLFGIWKFRPLFNAINDSHYALVKEQTKLQAANRELEGFVSTVSHDLRSPLATIIGYAEYLEHKGCLNQDPKAMKCLAEIIRQGMGMAALMEDLLALAKVGYLERPAEPVSVGNILQEVLDELKERLDHARVTVQAGSLPQVHLPKTFLAEVLRNLVGNALIYASQEDDVIEIGGGREGKFVRFSVRDRGPGIPEDERERIFELFYRGSTGKSVKGTGVGLAIVQKIAKLYGGRAWVEAPPDGGSLFCFEVVDP